LNGGAQSVARVASSFNNKDMMMKPALVQPVDVHGNRLSTSVSVKCHSQSHLTNVMIDDEQQDHTHHYQCVVKMPSARKTDSYR
jgi:hypothetical protein